MRLRPPSWLLMTLSASALVATVAAQTPTPAPVVTYRSHTEVAQGPGRQVEGDA